VRDSSRTYDAILKIRITGKVKPGYRTSDNTLRIGTRIYDRHTGKELATYWNYTASISGYIEFNTVNVIIYKQEFYGTSDDIYSDEEKQDKIFFMKSIYSAFFQ